MGTRLSTRPVVRHNTRRQLDRERDQTVEVTEPDPDVCLSEDLDAVGRYESRGE